MKHLPAIAALLVVVGLTSCSDHPRPITTGKVVSGTIWHYSLGSGQSNTGYGLPPDSDVEVYGDVIVVRLADGLSLFVDERSSSEA